MTLSPTDAKRRAQVDLDDGRIGYLLFVPTENPHVGGRGNRAHGGPGGKVRVALESGAVISCDAERVTLSRTTSASTQPHGGDA